MGIFAIRLLKSERYMCLDMLNLRFLAKLILRRFRALYLFHPSRRDFSPSHSFHVDFNPAAPLP